MATNNSGGNLPLDMWIVAPLMATARGNAALAETTLDYVRRIAFENPDEPDSAPRLLTFNVERKYKKPTEDGFGSETLQIVAPVLALLPIPALLVDEVQIEFSTSVTQIKSDAESSSSKKTVSSKSDQSSFLPGTNSASTQLTGGLSVQSDHTRKSDYRSTYTFKLRASQQEVPEGMARLTDMMSAVMEPTPTPNEIDTTAGKVNSTQSTSGKVDSARNKAAKKEADQKQADKILNGLDDL